MTCIYTSLKKYKLFIFTTISYEVIRHKLKWDLKTLGIFDYLGHNN